MKNDVEKVPFGCLIKRNLFYKLKIKVLERQLVTHKRCTMREIIEELIEKHL